MAIHPGNPLEHDPRIWRASQSKASHLSSVTTGFSDLDRLLAGDGWPRGTLIDCHCPQAGIGEVELFRTAMTILCQQHTALFWVDPPHTPYAPALERAGILPEQFFMIRTTDDEDRVWTLEQLLRSPVSGLVIGWGRNRDPAWLRRLQLAAENGDTLGILVTTGETTRAPSPAPVRLVLSPAPQQSLEVRILRQRGGRAGHIQLPLPSVTTDDGAHARDI